jgi:hypothetical protein
MAREILAQDAHDFWNSTDTSGVPRYVAKPYIKLSTKPKMNSNLDPNGCLLV